jgi:1-acyl-sn-glycerol-3-phosphate acyltransferase
MIILRRLLAILRLIAFALFTMGCILVYSIRSIFVGRQLSWSMKMRIFWCKVMFPILGVKLKKSGNVSDQPALYVANHISYIDPAVIIKYAVNGRVIGKYEVSKWPIIGMAGDVTGAIFVERENKGSRKSVRDVMAAAFDDGYSIVNFPEGTTGPGGTTLPFLKGGFEVAFSQGIDVIPVALIFDNPYAPFLKDEVFLHNWVRTFGLWRTNVTVDFGPIISGKDSTELTTKAEAWINQKLGQMV